jgi:hypothetical protein
MASKCLKNERVYDGFDGLNCMAKKREVKLSERLFGPKGLFYFCKKKPNADVIRFEKQEIVWAEMHENEEWVEAKLRESFILRPDLYGKEKEDIPKIPCIFTTYPPQSARIPANKIYKFDEHFEKRQVSLMFHNL